jgi:hypothetical protein
MPLSELIAKLSKQLLTENLLNNRNIYHFSILLLVKNGSNYLLLAVEQIKVYTHKLLFWT